MANYYPCLLYTSYHLWAPEIHRINNKWYIYFAADDGNMDNHQIYVVENEAANPMEGTFVMKGRIQTDKDNNWAIHASTFEHDGQRYMISVSYTHLSTCEIFSFPSTELNIWLGAKIAFGVCVVSTCTHP